MPEEESFAVFVKLMQDYKMRDMFKPTMAELGLCMFQLENLVQVLCNEKSLLLEQCREKEKEDEAVIAIPIIV